MGGHARGLARASGPLVEFDETPLSFAEVTPGDLVFIGSDDTILGAVVSELDGCAFSHVGVVAPTVEPTLWSARTDRLGGFHSPDLGGVRPDALSTLVPRGLFVAPLALDRDVRQAGLAWVAPWLEEHPRPEVSYSRFSYAKLVATSIALAAVRRREPLDVDDAEDLWEASWKVARRLAWRGGHPGFYCAEVVAAMYDLEFDVDAFWVCDGEPHPTGIAAHLASPPLPPVELPPLPPSVVDELAIDLRERSRLRFLLDEAAEVLDAFEEVEVTMAQAAAVAGMVTETLVHDPRLGWRLFTAARELRGHEEPHEPTDPPPGPFVPPAFLSRFTDPLPTALVTPRMLLSSSVVTSVHPLELT